MTENEQRQFKIGKMQEGFTLLDKALSIFEDMDPDAPRFAQVMSAIHDAAAPYRIILEEKVKQVVQTTIHQYFGSSSEK